MASSHVFRPAFIVLFFFGLYCQPISPYSHNAVGEIDTAQKYASPRPHFDKICDGTQLGEELMRFEVDIMCNQLLHVASIRVVRIDGSCPRPASRMWSRHILLLIRSH